MKIRSIVFWLALFLSIPLVRAMTLPLVKTTPPRFQDIFLKEDWDEKSGNLFLDQYKDNVNVQDQAGLTALTWAVKQGNVRIVTWLLTRAEIDPNACDGDGKTGYILALENKDQSMIDLFENNRAIDINSTLVWAAEYERIDVVGRYIHKEGINLDIKDVRGYTALHWAAIKGNTAIMRLLLDAKKSDINCRDKDENTPLLLAVAHGQDKAVALLLEKEPGNTINCKNRRGETPLIRAVIDGKKEIAQMLLAVKGIDINCAKTDGKTALIAAMYYGSVTMNMLIELKDIDISAEDPLGRTAFMWAARNGHISSLECFLRLHKIPLNEQDVDGNSALILAAKEGKVDAVACLLKEDLVKINMQGKWKQTALMFAAAEGHEKVAALLLEQPHINSALHNTNNKDALQLAQENNHSRIVTLLTAKKTKGKK